MAPTALVCDDDPVLRGVVGHLVEEHGWQLASELDSAVDTIAAAEHLHPDLVVLDIALRGMSGLEALPRIHAVSPQTRVIVLSSYDQSFGLARQAGAVEVFTKSDFAGLAAALYRLAPWDGDEDEDDDALEGTDEVDALGHHHAPVHPVTVDEVDKLAALFDDFFS